jgi:hypothetical protein
MFRAGDVVYIKSQYDAGLIREYRVKRVKDNWVVIDFEVLIPATCKCKQKTEMQEMTFNEEFLIKKPS